MNISSAEYQGNLRVRLTHNKSGNVVITDAPTDNHGKGEAFSPTDLLSTSLAACMITIMGIRAGKHGFELGVVSASIGKEMLSDPRRVGRITVTMEVEDLGYSDEQKQILENAALTCPVAKSLSPDLDQVLEMKFV